MLSQLAPPPGRLDLNLNSRQMVNGPPSPTLSTVSFRSSVSWMADKTTTELIPLLKNAYSALKDKEKDLVLAAELGKSLLEHNMKLKSSYDSLVKLSTPPITPSSSTQTYQENLNIIDDPFDDDSMGFIPSRTTREAMMEVLERKNAELSLKLEKAMIDQENIEKSNSKKTRQLENEINSLRSNLDIASSKIQELQEMNQRQKKLDLTQSIKKESSETDELVDELYEEIHKIQAERDNVLQSKAELEAKLAATLKDLTDLKQQFEKFDFTQNDFNELQEAYERQFNHINELNGSLEEHRTILQKLKDKGININSARSTPAPSTYGDLSEEDHNNYRKNTLLQELETEWFKSNKSLSSVHDLNSQQLVTFNHDVAPSVASSNMFKLCDLQEFRDNTLAAFYNVPSIGFESVLSKATGLDQHFLDETLDFINKIEQEHNKEKCMALYHDFMDEEDFELEDEGYLPQADLYPPTDDASYTNSNQLQLQPYVPTEKLNFIGRLKNQIRKLFRLIWKWCRFAIVLTTALLISAWKGPDSLLLTY